MPRRSNSDSSEEEDEEEIKRLTMALDPDFMKSCNAKKSHVNGQEKSAENDPEDAPISKRPKLAEFEYFKPYSLDISVDSQKFIAKKLSKSLSKNLDEISYSVTLQPSSQEASANLGIRLFSSSQCPLTERDFARDKKANVQKSRKKKKKRKEEEEQQQASPSDSSDSDSNLEKLRSIAVTAEWVLNKE